MKKTGPILLLLLLPMLMWAASAADLTPERQRKADYYLTGALVREAAEERDASFMMLRRAWELDSLGSVETGGLYGARLMTLSRGDSALFHIGLRLLGLQFESDPTDLYAGYNLALNYERIGRNDDALRVWAKLDSLNPENAGVLWKRAAAEVLYGSKADALGLLDRVERLEGINPDIAVRKVGLMLQDGDTAAALATVSRLLEAMPADAEARVYAAALYDQVGDTAL
ncbi:MAG: hypothetical protein K2M97_04285, partial [Muribaculaceae bacterium]|nr:hypothetical protein [Muribaculaceae bacterium]